MKASLPWGAALRRPLASLLAPLSFSRACSPPFSSLPQSTRQQAQVPLQSPHTSGILTRGKAPCRARAISLLSSLARSLARSLSGACRRFPSVDFGHLDTTKAQRLLGPFAWQPTPLEDWLPVPSPASCVSVTRCMRAPPLLTLILSFAFALLSTICDCSSLPVHITPGSRHQQSV